MRLRHVQLAALALVLFGTSLLVVYRALLSAAAPGAGVWDGAGPGANARRSRRWSPASASSAASSASSSLLHDERVTVVLVDDRNGDSGSGGADGASGDGGTGGGGTGGGVDWSVHWPRAAFQVARVVVPPEPPVPVPATPISPQQRSGGASTDGNGNGNNNNSGGGGESDGDMPVAPVTAAWWSTVLSEWATHPAFHYTTAFVLVRLPPPPPPRVTATDTTPPNGLAFDSSSNGAGGGGGGGGGACPGTTWYWQGVSRWMRDNTAHACALRVASLGTDAAAAAAAAANPFAGWVLHTSDVAVLARALTRYDTATRALVPSFDDFWTASLVVAHTLALAPAVPGVRSTGTGTAAGARASASARDMRPRRTRYYWQMPLMSIGAVTAAACDPELTSGRGGTAPTRAATGFDLRVCQRVSLVSPCHVPSTVVVAPAVVVPRQHSVIVGVGAGSGAGSGSRSGSGSTSSSGHDNGHGNGDTKAECAAAAATAALWELSTAPATHAVDVVRSLLAPPVESPPQQPQPQPPPTRQPVVVSDDVAAQHANHQGQQDAAAGDPSIDPASLSSLSWSSSSLAWQQPLAVLIPHLCDMTRAADTGTWTEVVSPWARAYHADWWPRPFFAPHVYRVARNHPIIVPPPPDAAAAAAADANHQPPPLARSAASLPGNKGGNHKGNNNGDDDDARRKQWQQALDYMDILEHWYHQQQQAPPLGGGGGGGGGGGRPCGGHEWFLFAEDDVEPCPGMLEYLGLVLQWMRLHRGEWGFVRVGVGFSGLLFRCADIPALLQYLTTVRSARNPRVDRLPIDWLVDTWRDAHTGSRPPYVFRWNLLRHAGHDAGNIWSGAEARARSHETAQCLELNNWRSEPAGHFNVRHCAPYLFSPCDNASADRDRDRDRDLDLAVDRLHHPPPLPPPPPATVPAAVSGVPLPPPGSGQLVPIASPLPLAGYDGTTTPMTTTTTTSASTATATSTTTPTTTRGAPVWSAAAAAWLMQGLVASGAVVTGALGQNCDEACRASGVGVAVGVGVGGQQPRRCDALLLAALNRCDLMQALQPGCMCVYGAGRELPMFYSDVDATATDATTMATTTTTTTTNTTAKTPQTAKSCHVQIFPARRLNCTARWNQARRLCACTK